MCGLFLYLPTGAVKLTSLACGNQHIWACDSRGGVYFRVGTQPLNPSLMLPAWIMIEPPVQVSKTAQTTGCSSGDQGGLSAVPGSGATPTCVSRWGQRQESLEGQPPAGAHSLTSQLWNCELNTSLKVI